MKKIVNLSVLIIALTLTLTVGMGIMSLVANCAMSFGGSSHSILFKIAHAAEQIYWEDIPRCCIECWNQNTMISVEELKDIVNDLKNLYR